MPWPGWDLRTRRTYGPWGGGHAIGDCGSPLGRCSWLQSERDVEHVTRHHKLRAEDVGGATYYAQACASVHTAHILLANGQLALKVYHGCGTDLQTGDVASLVVCGNRLDILAQLVTKWFISSWNWKPSTKTVWKHLANAQAALLRRLLEAPELWQASPNMLRRFRLGRVRNRLWDFGWLLSYLVRGLTKVRSDHGRWWLGLFKQHAGDRMKQASTVPQRRSVAALPLLPQRRGVGVKSALGQILEESQLQEAQLEEETLEAEAEICREEAQQLARLELQWQQAEHRAEAAALRYQEAAESEAASQQQYQQELEELKQRGDKK
ncbi:unnamed protein product, partial [Effrenium voratum]